MNEIRHGIIGLGFFGEIHAEILSTMPGVELVALSTRRPEHLKNLADKFNVTKRYTDYRSLLADEDVDSVSIVTHINDHSQIAIEALEAGKHVFLEKPMAGTPEECDRIIDAVNNASGKFMVGHICRFDPRVYQAKQAIEAGKIGEIKSIHATRNLPATIGAEVLDKISPLMGDGIHDTDLMLWFTKGKIETVYAQNIRIRDFKHPDGGWAMYRFKNGAVGIIETIWCLPENTPYAIDARMEIIGTEGAIYIDCGNAGLTINDQNGLSKPDTAYWPYVKGIRVGALRDEFSYFFRCISEDCPITMITPEESKYAVEVICAAEESAHKNNIVKMD